MRTIILASFLLLCVTLLFAQPVSAAPATSVFDDPEGDAFINLNFVEPRRAPDFLDLIRGQITQRGGLLIFNIEVAGPVPDEPVLPPEAGVISWEWFLDTDEATVPFGFPFSPGSGSPPEFFVLVTWDGTQFEGVLIDRRPLLFGEDAVLTPLPFSIEGNTVSVSVSRRMLDKPEFFWVLGSTIARPLLGENNSWMPTDIFDVVGWTIFPPE